MLVPIERLVYLNVTPLRDSAFIKSIAAGQQCLLLVL